MEEEYSRDNFDVLKREKEELEKNFEICESNLTKAAEFGQQLLQSKQELSDKLEQLSKDNACKVEELEQHNYSLQRKLDVKERLEVNYSNEIESANKEIDKLKKTIDGLKEENKQILDKNKEISRLSCEVEKGQQTEKQLLKRQSEIEASLKEAEDKLNQSVVIALNETTGEEYAGLKSQIDMLQSEKTTLVHKHNNEMEDMRKQLEKLNSDLQSKSVELEERQCEVTAYYNALEKAREEYQELKVELDLLKMETQQTKAKGNSLFSEVEDRRVEAEKTLITLKVKYETIQKQHQILKENLHMYKVQMAAVFQMSSSRVDQDHLKSLKQQLHHARNQIVTLGDELKQSQEQHSQSICLDISKYSENRSSGDFESYLKTLLKTKEREMVDLKKELSQAKLLFAAESHRTVEFENKFYEAERKADKAVGQSMRLQLKLEELRLKYEPDSLVSKQKRKPGKVEVLDFSKENEKENETEQQIQEEWRNKGTHLSTSKIQPKAADEAKIGTKKANPETNVKQPELKSADQKRKLANSSDKVSNAQSTTGKSDVKDAPVDDKSSDKNGVKLIHNKDKSDNSDKVVGDNTSEPVVAKKPKLRPQQNKEKKVVKVWEQPTHECETQ